MERSGFKEGERFVTRRIVIKIGTSTITAGKAEPDANFMLNVARQAAELRSDGVEVVIVSSGAVALGRDKESEDADVIGKQSDSMFGQPELIQAWKKAFEPHGVKKVGQALYTDINFEKGADITRATLLRSLPRGAIIVNYNDAVADEEMRKVERSADNDKLAGNVARLIEADTLLILTDVDGVLDKGELIPVVDRLEDVEDLLHSGGTGTGGAWSKWVEAKSIANEGKRSIIANGRTEDVILKVAKGENVGTLFVQSYMLPRG